MNRGDTACLILNYNLNGSPLAENEYQEIELQINEQSSLQSIKKLLSKKEIEWTSVTYLDDEGIEQSFTGYVAYLSQEETFKLSSGVSNVQLRIMLNDEVGSSAFTALDLGKVLSREVLEDDTTIN